MPRRKKKEKTKDCTVTELSAVYLLFEDIKKLTDKGWLRASEKEKLCSLLDEWEKLPKRLRQLACKVKLTK